VNASDTKDDDNDNNNNMTKNNTTKITTTRETFIGEVCAIWSITTIKDWPTLITHCTVYAFVPNDQNSIQGGPKK